MRFWAGTSDAGFLFDSGIVAYIEAVSTKATDFHYRLQSVRQVGKDHDEHIEAAGKLQEWFGAQLRPEGLAQVFAPFLRFQDLNGRVSISIRRVIENVRKH
jgi:hypothetical protein